MIFEGIQAFGSGYSFIDAKNTTDEILQGRTYYIAAFYQMGQNIFLAALIQKVAEAVCVGAALSRARTLCNVVPLLTLPFGLLAAVAKEGHYEKIVEALSGYRIVQLLPRSMGKVSKQVLSFFAVHSSTLSHLAFIVSAVALLYLGQTVYASTLLALLVYRELSLRVLPHKVGLFLEGYLPAVADIALLVGGGTLLTSVFAGVSLLSYLSFVNRMMCHRIDLLARAILPYMRQKWHVIPQTPSLREYEAPLVERRDMTIADVNEVLNGEQIYEINPAHCSKGIVDRYALPQDRSFDELLVLFNQINWANHSVVIQKKLKNDPQFCEEHAGQRVEDLTAAYCVEWVRKQMEFLVDGLKGKRVVQGSKADLDIAMADTAKVLAYLKTLRNSQDRESCLLRLAIEAGDYCARGKKQVAAEIVDEIVVPSLTPESVALDDPQKMYELRLFQALQNLRRGIVQQQYRDVMQSFKIPAPISSDVHGYDIYRCLLSLGFAPMSAMEREKIGAGEIPEWTMYAGHRQVMHTRYKDAYASVFQEIGDVHFFTYMSRLIESMPRLSAADKERLQAQLSSSSEYLREYSAKWRRLALVILGVLRPRSQ